MDFLHYITQINGLIGAIISETYKRHILRINIFNDYTGSSTVPSIHRTAGRNLLKCGVAVAPVAKWQLYGKVWFGFPRCKALCRLYDPWCITVKRVDGNVCQHDQTTQYSNMMVTEVLTTRKEYFD